MSWRNFLFIKHCLKAQFLRPNRYGSCQVKNNLMMLVQSLLRVLSFSSSDPRCLPSNNDLRVAVHSNGNYEYSTSQILRLVDKNLQKLIGISKHFEYKRN